MLVIVPLPWGPRMMTDKFFAQKYSIAERGPCYSVKDPVSVYCVGGIVSAGCGDLIKVWNCGTFIDLIKGDSS